MAYFWTIGELRRLFKRRLAGESTASLAAEHGIKKWALLRAWRRVGLYAGPIYDQRRVTPEEDQICRRAYLLHIDGATWNEVIQRLGWAGTKAALRSRVNRWTKRATVIPKWRGNTEAALAQRAKSRKLHEVAP